MVAAQMLVALSIAAPGVLSYRSMRNGEHGRLPAVGGATLFSVLWAGVVGLILSVSGDTAIPGELWAALATAVVVTEAFFARPPQAE